MHIMLNMVLGCWPLTNLPLIPSDPQSVRIEGKMESFDAERNPRKISSLHYALWSDFKTHWNLPNCSPPPCL